MNKSYIAELVLIGVEKVKNTVDHGVDRFLDKYEEVSDWAEHMNNISAAEAALKEANPDLFEYLPEILQEIAAVPSLHPEELIAMLKEASRLKSTDSAPR